MLSVMDVCVNILGYLIAIFIVGAYSHITFVIFGHKTFWRQSFCDVDNHVGDHGDDRVGCGFDGADDDATDEISRHDTFKSFGCKQALVTAIRKMMMMMMMTMTMMDHKESKLKKSVAMMKEKNPRTFINSFVNLSKLQHDLFVEMVGFLNAMDVLALIQSSKSFHCILNDNPVIWKQLSAKCFGKYPDFQDWLNQAVIETKLSLSPKLTFFVGVAAIPHYVVQTMKNEPTTNVIVHQEVFALPPSFVDVHPGGHSILLHYHQRDATIVFDVACHSKVARNIARQYLAWSPSGCLGKQGNLDIISKQLANIIPAGAF